MDGRQRRQLPQLRQRALTAGLAPVVDDDRPAQQPTWSPDGRALVHTLVDADGPTVVVQPVNPVGERVVVGRDDAAWWSPG
ncbi:MAG: hypothetical protein H8E59_01220 [Actinobacteria bacterium]|nr:hypothetical protein [Actinomycetota bacterium]